ncbi:MAG: phenylalanine--tRNA ligase subunit beta [Candidatus Sungbacteria bacterium]|nr:phenylalanine--tRNA ligase subunit beta [Candidatus Sungbacteria bacterium]
MKYSYNWLKELVTFKDSPQELAEFLTLRAFEVESVEKRGDDWVLDVKITPNRVADCSGHWGLAREVAFLKKLRTPNSELRTQPAEDKKKKAAGFVRIKIEDSDDCPRYTARMMAGVAVKPSPQWLRERLEICGIQSINNVVDAANYVMLEIGQPLHVFDLKKLTTHNSQLTTIFVRRAKKGERILALDDKTYTLTPDVLVIADEKGPIAIAGIKGGKASGVSESTTALVLEAANFDPVMIRRGSRLLGLKTDASYRFEHGIAPNQTVLAIDRLALLICEISGGTILKGVADAYPDKSAVPKILFRVAYANQTIGKELSVKFYQGIFAAIGCGISAKKSGELIVDPPLERLDLRIEEDLVEEAARSLGYDRIPAILPHVSLAPAQKGEELFWEERVRTSLASAGYTEYQPYLFTGKRELTEFFVTEPDRIELENPTGPETQYLLPRLAIKYASAAAEILREHEEVLLFGIGKEFRAPESKKKELEIREEKRLVLAHAKKSSEKGELFYGIKGVVDRMLEGLGVSDHWYDDAIELDSEHEERKMFHPYQRAEIKIGDDRIGMIGMLHPAIEENIKSRGKVAIAEFDLSRLAKAANAEAEFRTIGKYPAIVRDIAVMVPERTKTEEITNVIEEHGAPLLIDGDLFDYFQDEELTARGTKSLAFHLVFQSPERTLKDEEVNATMQKIVVALEKEGWVVRK